MKAKELRNLNISELNEKLKDLRKKIVDLRFKKVIGELKDIKSIRNLRKDIARILTVINEKTKSKKAENTSKSLKK